MKKRLTASSAIILIILLSAGQQVTVRVSNNNFYNATVRLYAPDGSMLTQSWTSGATLNLPTQTLAINGTYRITIDSMGTSTGQMNVNVTNP